MTGTIVLRKSVGAAIDRREHFGTKNRNSPRETKIPEKGGHFFTPGGRGDTRGRDHKTVNQNGMEEAWQNNKNAVKIFNRRGEKGNQRAFLNEMSHIPRKEMMQGVSMCWKGRRREMVFHVGGNSTKVTPCEI